MDTKKDYINSTEKPGDDTIISWMGEYKNWKDELKKYWVDIKKDQQTYEFRTDTESESSSNVSLNVAFSMVESMIAKGNDSTLNVTVKAKGNNDVEDFEEYVSGVVKDSIEDQDVASFNGTFRKQKEMHSRDFYVKGNAVSEVTYFYKTSILNGEKKVLADNPKVNVLPLFSVIFNPSGYLDSSDVYYVEKNVSWKKLKDEEYKEQEVIGADGKKSTEKTGKYFNLAELKNRLGEDGKLLDDEDMDNYTMEHKVRRKKEPIRLLERWEGAKLCTLAMIGTSNDAILIRDDYDPLKIGRNGLLISMNYKVEGRPYAYGEIAAIYKVICAQDTVLNQKIEAVNRYLRPSVLVSDYDADLDTIIEVMEHGGVTYGNAQGIASVPTNIPPQAAFLLGDELQAAVERAGRWSPYATGQVSQQTDKTAGTASGINSIQMAAEPNYKVKQDAIEDSYMQPYGSMTLQMIGNLMGADEVRYTVLRGAKTEWVKATKGIMMGKATVQDMVTIGMLKEEEIPAFLEGMGLAPDPESMTATIVFDVDWMVDTKLDNQSKVDKQAEIEQKIAWIQFAQEMGVQFNPKRVASRIGKEQGIENPEELFMSDEEIAQQQQEMQQQQQAQQEQQMAAEQQKQQAVVQQKQMDIQAQREQQQLQQEAALAQEKIKGINQINVASTRVPAGVR